MRKSFRYILFPFSVLYGGVIWLRNALFDKGIIRSATFNLPLICVGNLAVGGTGKTPMVEYLIRFLENKYIVATLSRGYKRKTRGFAIADENTTSLEIGDEPMQLHNKFPEITVAVAEERIVGIPQLLHERPATEVILLDDAFQHREVRAGLTILLTGCNELYTRDSMLPAGNLRDVKSSSKRANIIVVTKCNKELTTVEKEKLVEELHPFPGQLVFFSAIEYGNPYHLFTNEVKIVPPGVTVLLVCGIANPKPLQEHISGISDSSEMILFKDHHIFSSDDLADIKKRFSKIENQQKIILTTEKDGVRLAKYSTELRELPIYVIPMQHKLLFDEGDKFEKIIIDFVESFRDDEN